MEKIKLNIGSGRQLLPDFINIDSEFDFKKKNFVKADVRDLSMFKENSVDYILARQVLEHIPFLNIPNTLKEWVRVLKKGGRMVITCPNFNLMAEDWLNSEFEINQFWEMTKGIFGGQTFERDTHLTPITPELLNYYLSKMPVKGSIKSYKRGSETMKYPGYLVPKGHIYRYGEVHVDVKKI